jgi:hypothetical protein
MQHLRKPTTLARQCRELTQRFGREKATLTPRCSRAANCRDHPREHQVAAVTSARIRLRAELPRAHLCPPTLRVATHTPSRALHSQPSRDSGSDSKYPRGGAIAILKTIVCIASALLLSTRTQWSRIPLNRYWFAATLHHARKPRSPLGVLHSLSPRGDKAYP